MTPRGGRRASWGAALAAIAALVVFAPAVRFGFVYDDHWTIEHNRWIGAPLGRVLAIVLRGRAQSSGIPDATRPTMLASTWIDHRLFGLSPVAYHAHSLLLYALVTLLAWAVVLFVTARPRAALAGALFFAIAPIHAEAVAAINYREDLLAALGIFVPLAILLRRRSAAISLTEALVASFAWLVGLGAKESALALVLLVLATMAIRRVDRAWVRARERALLGLGAALLVWCNWRAALFLKGDDIPRAPAKSVLETVAATARFEVRMIANAFAPFAWSPEHGRPPPASPWWIVALAALVVAAVALARSPALRVYALGLTFALLAPLAASPLARPVNEIADRYAFVAVLGAAIVYGAAWDRLARSVRGKWATAVLVAAGVPLAAIALRAASPWRSDEALWTAAVDRAPQSPRAWVGLARVRRLAGDVDAADAAVDRALALDDAYLPARVTRAYNHLARGDVTGASRELDEVGARGGATLGGVARARKCATLDPDRARQCAVASP